MRRTFVCGHFTELATSFSPTYMHNSLNKYKNIFHENKFLTLRNKKTRVPTLKVAPSELPILGLLSSDYFQAAV
jgi:hypothetical protein